MQSIIPVAILIYQMEECLRIRSVVHFDAAFGLFSRDIFVFRLDWFYELQSTFAIFGVSVCLSVGIQQRDDGIDGDKVQ